MHWPPGGGGADRYFYGLMTGLGATDARFRAVAFDGDSADVPLSGNFESLGSKRLGWLDRMRRLHDSVLRFDREAGPDSIIATHFAFYALPMLGQLRKHTHIVHFHGPWADESLAEGGGTHVVFRKTAY